MEREKESGGTEGKRRVVKRHFLSPSIATEILIMACLLRGSPNCIGLTCLSTTYLNSLADIHAKFCAHLTFSAFLCYFTPKLHLIHSPPLVFSYTMIRRFDLSYLL